MIISDQTKGTLFCVVGVLVLTPDAFYIRSVSNMPDFTVQFYRYLIFGLTVLCFFCIREGGQTLQKIKAIGVWGGLAGIAFGASNVCVTTAFQHTAAANALVIIASGPIFSALFSFLVLKEMVPLRTVAAGCVCFAAVALILQAEVQKGGNERLGVFCALSASILNGIYFTLLRLVSIKQSPMPDTLPCVFISGLVAATIAVCTGPNLRAVDSMDWLFLVIMGVIELPISFSLLSYGPGLIPAPEVSLYFLFETVLGPLWVWLGGYEAPPIYSIYGGAMMITAMAAHSYLALRELKQKEDSLLFGVPAPTRSVDGGL